MREFIIDTSGHNELFYQAFDKLIQLQYGEFARVIYFYLYERKAPDGSINILRDEDGEEVKLDNAGDLWELISRMKPLTED